MNKGKIKLYLLYIFTFGIGYLYLRSKAKKLKDVENEELSLSETIPINVEKLIEYLGGIENIKNATHTISSIKIFLDDLSIVQIDKIKKLGVSGFMKGKDYISFLFGDFSHLLSEELLKKISV